MKNFIWTLAIGTHLIGWALIFISTWIWMDKMIWTPSLWITGLVCIIGGFILIAHLDNTHYGVD